MNQDTTMSDKIPVTVLTGYLGAGKTTLLNRILTENHGLRIAVIENEYGEIGIDQEMVINADEEVFEMNNGCVCCTVRGDLIRILGSLARRKRRFDRVIVETTGIANPAPVAQTFFADEEIQALYQLDGIVTVLDAKHLLLHLDRSQECREQVAFGDVLLLNKTDLVTPDELAEVERRVRRINAFAELRHTHRADAPMDLVLRVGGFDLDRALEAIPTFLARANEGAHDHDHAHDHAHDHGHDCDDDCHHEHHHDHHEHRHEHEDEVGSVAISFAGDLAGDRLNAWMGLILRELGQDIYRMKGILSLRGQDKRYIFQAVHMQFEGREDKPWGDRPRLNQMVFIGRHLDRTFLENGLKACLA
jgi:G3E family GTPase